MQIVVLAQQVTTTRIRARAAFWRDGVPTTDPPLFIQEFDLPRVASVTRRVEDAAGRLLTQSGQWVLPEVEVDGEWVPRPDSAADPYKTETVAVNAAAHARQQALTWAEWRASQIEE
jgi:hypothetical protein